MSHISNEVLRAHVTSTAFDLTLRKTHVAALVMLAEALATRKFVDSRHPMLRTWISAMDGLRNRGLITHSVAYDAKGKTKRGLHHHYTITKAGRLVISLLKEAGIYQEYADARPTRDAGAA